MSFDPSLSVSFPFGDHTVKIESGHIATQAKSSVLLTMGKSMVMVNITHAKADPNRDFFPLTVHYSEKFYSVGRIPGSFNRREGRPSEREVVIARIIDRSIRPMFADGFMDEVQVNVSLLNHDKTVSPDIPSVLATAAALAITDLPFNIVAAARIGFHNDAFLLNPSEEALKESGLDLVVSHSESSFIMVESSAKELPEKDVLAALNFAKEQLQPILGELKKLQDSTAQTTWEPEDNSELDKTIADIQSEYGNEIAENFTITDKKKRNNSRQETLKKITEALTANLDEDTRKTATDLIGKAVYAIEKKWVRSQIIAKKPRIDGRDHKTVRPIDIKVGFLPDTHGSVLFTRGETQALVVTTLSDEGSAQIIDDITAQSKDRFMLQYNFPSFCVGECGIPMSPKRREIGHGRLARKAILQVVPEESEAFPYVVRIVSETLSSNGSSSMATVCGASLSLMDAGVQISEACAGIAMGLVIDGSDYTVLTDILGDEDFLGDMDFKVAGTKNGITALQMDIKTDGITNAILEDALAQAREGRFHILGIMNQAIDKPRAEVAANAPRVTQFKIPASKIREVIGRGGSTIKEIIEKYEVSIDISDDGLVKVTSSDAEKALNAQKHIETITAELELNRTYEGKIVKIMDFGAFVNVLPGKDAFLHISQICHERVDNIHHKLSEGQIVRVKVVEIDRQNRAKLSMKDIEQHITDSTA